MTILLATFIAVFGRAIHAAKSSCTLEWMTTARDSAGYQPIADGSGRVPPGDE